MWARRTVVGFLQILVLSSLLGSAVGQPPPGLGVSPGEVRIPSAQAGQSYVATVEVQSSYDHPSQMTIDRLGEAGLWTTTQPAGSFTIPPHAAVKVTFTIQVPAQRGPGTAAGQVTFSRAAEGSPTGSGAVVQPGVGVLLNLTVGGAAVERVTWGAARVEDAAHGAEVRAYAMARNDGNVRTTAHVRGQVLEFAGEGVLRAANGTRSLRPGEEAEVPLAFPAGLGVGQYRARLRAVGPNEGLDQTLPFKVHPPGQVPPDGQLRAILHLARATAGQPLRIDARFENTGAQAIALARFNGEARQGDLLLAPLQSEAVAVAPGQTVNLTVYWTPPRAGTYTVAGAVLYDGYLTPEATSRLNVDAPGLAGTGAGWLWGFAFLGVAMAGFGWFFFWWRRRKDKAPAPPPAPPPPPSTRAPQGKAKKGPPDLKRAAGPKRARR